MTVFRNDREHIAYIEGRLGRTLTAEEVDAVLDASTMLPIVVRSQHPRREYDKWGIIPSGRVNLLDMIAPGAPPSPTPSGK